MNLFWEIVTHPLVLTLIVVASVIALWLNNR